MIPKLNGPGKDGVMEFIRGLGNRPNLENGLDADALKAKFDAAAEYIKTYINEVLIPAIIAENISFKSTTGNVSGETITQALEWLKEQITVSQLGQIGDNTITAEKLSAEVRALVESAVLVVSEDAPTGENNVETGFPLYQLWLRMENDLCEELYLHEADGVWWSIIKRVLPASRGGTGIGAHAEGSVLYGRKDGSLASLEKPDETSFLMFSDKLPVWGGKDTARNALGVLNIATGTYTGDGVDGREVALTLEDGTAVEPKLITIYCADGAREVRYREVAEGTVTLCQGAEAAAIWGSVRDQLYCVKLDGSKLKFRVHKLREDDEDSYKATYFNGETVVYNWSALY